MATQTATPTPNIFAAFERFISQRSGIESGNYFSPYDRGAVLAEGVKAFRAEQRTITNQGKRARAALETAKSFPFNPEAMADALQHSFSGRLSIAYNADKRTPEGEWPMVLVYTTGQYFPTEYRQAAAVVLETYIHAVTPKTVPAAGSRFTTISQIKAASLASGSHWFDKDSMRFFKCNVYGSPVIQGNDERVYFITSEQNGDEPRAYSIRVFDPTDASIDTVGESQAYATKGDAVKVAYATAKIARPFQWVRLPHAEAEAKGLRLWTADTGIAPAVFYHTDSDNPPAHLTGYNTLSGLLQYKGISTEGGR